MFPWYENYVTDTTRHADSLFTESPPFIRDIIFISRKHSYIFSMYLILLQNQSNWFIYLFIEFSGHSFIFKKLIQTLFSYAWICLNILLICSQTVFGCLFVCSLASFNNRMFYCSMLLFSFILGEFNSYSIIVTASWQLSQWFMKNKERKGRYCFIFIFPFYYLDLKGIKPINFLKISKCINHFTVGANIVQKQCSLMIHVLTCESPIQQCRDYEFRPYLWLSCRRVFQQNHCENTT